MKNLYTAPFRVYLCAALLAVVGIYAGFKLPVSLFPNSNKPTIQGGMSYGASNSKEFLGFVGHRIEQGLRAISTDDLKVETVTANYRSGGVQYNVEFNWGADPKEALREVKGVLHSYSAMLGRESRDSIWTNYWSKSSGFIAISFYSEQRSSSELFDLLEPLFAPKLAEVEDAENPGLWNPEKKELRVTLKPEAMATLGLFPKQIGDAINRSLSGYKAGQVTVGPKRLNIEMPREAGSIEELRQTLIATPKGRVTTLAEVATVELVVSEKENKIFKTSGAKSLILFSEPKTGGNVKKMAEHVRRIVDEIMLVVPKDIRFRVLVDPSEFIRAAVENVFHEVALAAGLAVLVLFLFIGNLKNIITAAIEIPLSMVLAFILMKLTGMNINLISLGGLALSAGMNVDASVVVMENIFHNFDKVKGHLNYQQRLKLVVSSVREVMFPVLGATIASLVVFVPLAFTSDLTNAVLGDLSKAVVFSHGFSVFVALLLVPTIRLHLMNSESGADSASIKSPIAGTIKRIEFLYTRALTVFIRRKWLHRSVFVGAMAGLVALMVFVLPQLKKEIIGTPDTDWIILGVRTSGNTLIKQMETTSDHYETELLQKFGNKISYTFAQIQGANRSNIMARLKDKSEMDVVWKSFQEHFTNTPEHRFWVEPWNPAEMPLPDLPNFEVEIRGGELNERSLVADSLLDRLYEKKAFSQQWAEPRVSKKDRIVIRPYLDKWPLLSQIGVRFSPRDIADLSRVATVGRMVNQITLGSKRHKLYLQYPEGYIKSKEDLDAMPIQVDKRLVPLSSLAHIGYESAETMNSRENGRSLIKLIGRVNKGEEDKIKSGKIAATEVVNLFKKDYIEKLKLKSKPSITIVDAEKELTQALDQLTSAIGLSIVMIFFVLLLQFGSIIHTIIVLSAIPLGIMGVLISLWVFGSTVSLNSALGVILLNGIAVANSIILVDRIKNLVDSGMAAEKAAITAARNRLRPILITSLTTILGMLPIAWGMGEGGKILQPLGIAVAGGLWVSMIFTLFFVPSLEVLHYQALQKYWPSRKRRPVGDGPPLDSEIFSNIADSADGSGKPVNSKTTDDSDLWL